MPERTRLRVVPVHEGLHHDEPLRFREREGALHGLRPTAHRLLAEDVLSGFERGEGQLLMVLAAVLPARDDVDDVDVDAA